MKAVNQVLKVLDINPKGRGITCKDDGIKVILEQMSKGISPEIRQQVLTLPIQLSSTIHLK